MRHSFASGSLPDGVVLLGAASVGARSLEIVQLLVAETIEEQLYKDIDEIRERKAGRGKTAQGEVQWCTPCFCYLTPRFCGARRLGEVLGRGAMRVHTQVVPKAHRYPRRTLP